jgi:hypothetical protein
MSRFLNGPMARFEKTMKRHVRTKLRILSVRHPGLEDMVDAMFNEFWPVRDVKHMIAAQYGARLSMSSLQRHRSRHWQARRAMVQDTSAALARAEF